MTLPSPVRSAVLEVVRRLRDPMRECHVDNVGYMVCATLPESIGMRHITYAAALDALRLALNLSPVPGSLARWARGKSREEVAKALEDILDSR